MNQEKINTKLRAIIRQEVNSGVSGETFAEIISF
jgi:hypothetical protein